MGGDNRLLRSASSARWNDALFGAYDEDLHAQIVGYLVANLDKYFAEDCASAMVLIEALRQGKQLVKRDVNIHYCDEEHQKYVWPSEQRAQATELFRRWWGNGHEWPNNRSKNPLEGSRFEIYSWGG